MSSYTAAVIGCGSIAQHLHLPGYAKRKEITRIIGVDPEPARLAEIQANFPIAAVYADYREMFAHEHPDFVSVCTPNVFHAEQAIAALQSGAALLLEKPMTLTLEEAHAVAMTAQQVGKPVMIGFSHRFYRGNQRVKALLQEGAIGEPFMMRVRFAHSGPFPGWAKSDWFYDPKRAGGGALLDMGIHAIDLCQWLIGPITSVAAQMGTLRRSRWMTTPCWRWSSAGGRWAISKSVGPVDPACAVSKSTATTAPSSTTMSKACASAPAKSPPT